MHVRDICIAKYNGFCCLQKFNLFPKIEYHSLFSDLFIFYIFSENVWQYFWKYEKWRYSNSEMWVDPGQKNDPKVNRGLKIVNYFTCVRHFSCRWYGPPEIDLNGYPRISNLYCHDIQIWRCDWTLGKNITQSKSLIKNSKLFYMCAALLL